MTQVLRFLSPAAIGFLADAAMLALLLHRLRRLDPFVARVLSIGFALSVTWLAQPPS